jgi:hypothetical protein
MDGATVARALAALEKTLTRDLVTELQGLPARRAA